MMEGTQLIYGAMAQIMKSVEAIKKEKTNKQGEGFKYRGIDDVMNSLHDAFATAGVFIMPEVLERYERDRQSRNGGTLIYVTQKIKFHFIAYDGSEVTSVINGTAMDSGDKADNKSLSIALKYALLQAFLIPTEDMAEPDSQTHQVGPEKRQLTDEQLNNAIDRILKGDDIAGRIRETYVLNSRQSHSLEEAEKLRLSRLGQ